MRVLLITGSYPPDVCGTADYTARLCESLQRTGVDARVFYRKHWGLMRVPSLLNEIESLKPDLIHMQYPTTGYGWNLGPQGIGTIKPLIVTLHEASQAHLLRQISLYPFLVRCRHLIVTNQYEQKRVERLAPWIGGRTTIIPIGCNVPLAVGEEKLRNVITCFSIIRPEKGLEDVVEMARVLQAQGSSARVRVIGALMPRWTSYYSRLRAESQSLPVDWMVGLDDEVLSRMLAETSLAYLPFPDGASERRSSLIAMLMNGACVLTKIGAHTPEPMHESVVGVVSPAEAAMKAVELLADISAADRIAARGLSYAARFSWESISRQHLKTYEEVLSRG